MAPTIFRADVPEAGSELEQQLVAYIRKISPAHVLIVHYDDHADQRHIHGTLWSTFKSLRSLRTQLVRDVPGIKGKYSLAPPNPKKGPFENYERYMCRGSSTVPCKGDPVIILSAQAPVDHPDAGAYTAAWAAEQNRRWYDARKAYVAELVKERSKEKVIDVVRQQCIDSGVSDLNGICMKLVRRCMENSSPVSEHLIAGQTLTIWGQLHGKRAEAQLVGRISQRWYGLDDINISSTGTTSREDRDEEIDAPRSSCR